MPYYDYRCAVCGNGFEMHLPVALRDEASCPACGSRDVRRAMPNVYTLVKEAPRPAVAGCEGGCCGMEAGGGCACGCGS